MKSVRFRKIAGRILRARIVLSLVLQFIVGTVYAESPPILVLASGGNFGLYTTELLKAEGFNSFELVSPRKTNVSLRFLKTFRIVILAQEILSAGEAEMFEEFVKGGGRLIAFRPDKKLEAVFGIKDKGGMLNGADSSGKVYLSVKPNTEIGRGIKTTALRIHNELTVCSLDGADEIASAKAGSVPAIVSHRYGRGSAMAFLYNLPENIVLTRQGNYRQAGMEKDGISGIRAMDLFTDGWVDTANNRLNQADEQMSLLTHCIEAAGEYTLPLPRFWYFPDGLNCLVTLNNDGEDSKEASFETQLTDVDRAKAKMTLYVKETDYVSKPWVDSWIKKGFEMAGHPDDTRQASNPDWKTMDRVIGDLRIRLRARLGIGRVRTVVNHWFVWCGRDSTGAPDFAAQARIEEKNGIQLDGNYAHYDNHSNQGPFLGASGLGQGNYTGSGLILKFAGLDGRLINVYQQLNNVYDQQYMENKDPDGYFACFKGLMDRSMKEEVYSYISVKAHNDEYFFSKQPLMNMIAYANAKGVPVWTELHLLDYLMTREQAGFHEPDFRDGRLSFRIETTMGRGDADPGRSVAGGAGFAETDRGSAAGGAGFAGGGEKLTCMVPRFFKGRTASKVLSNGKAISSFIRSVKGTDYMFFLVEPGSAYDISVRYAVEPATSK